MKGERCTELVPAVDGQSLGEKCKNKLVPAVGGQSLGER